jgi:hypothetical protein
MDRHHSARIGVLVGVLIIVLIGSVSVHGQAGGESQLAKIAEAWLVESAFDPSLKELPVHFEGNTMGWVLRYGTLAPKSGMETSREFEERRRSFRAETYAFVLDQYQFSYDRATETATVKIPTYFPRMAKEPGAYGATFNISRTKLPPTSRAGPERSSPVIRSDPRRVPQPFERGAVTVTKRTWKQTQIVATESPASFKVAYLPLVFAVKMPPDLARRAKSSLRVAFVCIPAMEQYQPIGDPSVPEATDYEFTEGRPGQFSDQQVTYSITLRAELIQVWLFDQSTGEVYGRFTPPAVLAQ